MELIKWKNFNLVPKTQSEIERNAKLKSKVDEFTV